MLEAGGEGNCKEKYQSSCQSRGTMHAAGEQQRKGKNSTARAQPAAHTTRRVYVRMYE